MPFYRDSANAFPINFLDKDTGQPLDISAYACTFEMSQDGKTVTLSMGDGLAFETDGEDGVLNVTISKARINQFCAGEIRVRIFDTAGSDPVLIAEGGENLEGKRFDA